MVMKMREMMKKNDNQKGFTLIELIVVMAILAVLAGIAVPKFSNVLEDSKKKAHNANVDLIQKAVDLYAVNTNTALDAVDDINVLEPNYIKDIPDNPTGGDAYSVTDGIVAPAEVAVP